MRDYTAVVICKRKKTSVSKMEHHNDNRIRLYVASISSNREIKRKQQQIEHVLVTKHIPFLIVDIAANEEDKIQMRELSGNPTALPPLLFKGNIFLGGYDEFDDALEEGTLTRFLQL